MLADQARVTVTRGLAGELGRHPVEHALAEFLHRDVSHIEDIWPTIPVTLLPGLPRGHRG
jgi:hypothetical protein